MSKAEGDQKYVICNADEGDPGAFMDRSVLEGDPHRVLEGMAIAGYAIGASEGYVYVRGEYPLAVERLKKAIRQAQRMGFLGQNIFGTTFNFNIKIRLGAGAFVCGEETALIASIEGKRGQPRPRPPYPAELGLWGKPTLINNVETFANIAPIIRNGGAWYASIGVGKSKGTKVFALAGSIINTGLIEVPMGMSLREIVYEIGGGVSSGGVCKAVQTGGPSGGCIPEEYLDTPVQYESLKELGSIMGSGGMIVMDKNSCMVDVAKYFMEFCMTESCGKCIPCRVGTAHMHEILEKITRGAATMADLDMLMELGDMIRNTSLCGLGQTAPNPVFSTIRYFRDEFEAHILDKECAAGVCKINKVEEVASMKPSKRIKTLKIDGMDVGGRADETILELARENGIEIPTLCEMEGLSDVGACRLCLVEVKNWNKLVPACMTYIEEGMEVYTNSERLQKYRRMTIELLFSERNHICSVCVSNGHCELQDLAVSVGMDHVRLPYMTPSMHIDASHPYYEMDHNRCVLCTRCIRVCDEIEGAHTLDLRGRGKETRVIFDLDGEWGTSHHLHPLREMRTDLSDGRSGCQGAFCGRDGQTP